jgi:hypothetical protein
MFQSPFCCSSQPGDPSPCGIHTHLQQLLQHTLQLLSSHALPCGILCAVNMVQPVPAAAAAAATTDAEEAELGGDSQPELVDLDALQAGQGDARLLIRSSATASRWPRCCTALLLLLLLLLLLSFITVAYT